MVLGLLAAEILGVTGRDPGERYRAITEELGNPVYERIDRSATREQKAALKKLGASDLTASELAGDPILEILTEAPGNGAPIGGLKVSTAYGWFAARPSGTEEVYKLYAESFRGDEHLRRIQTEAAGLLERVFERA
jgi:phosphoglucomutase